MKLITKDTGYALRILVYMAQQKPGMLSVRRIARGVGVPHAFARRICQRLSKKKIISSQKGKGGGFVFCGKPSEISVRDIIRIFQGEIEFLDCFIRGHICGRIKRCTLRKKLKALEKDVAVRLDRITLKDLLKG